jgi:hypothetical protein
VRVAKLLRVQIRLFRLQRRQVDACVLERALR